MWLLLRISLIIFFQYDQRIKLIIEPQHNKTNKENVRPAKTQIRLGGSAWASTQSDQSLRCAHEETLGPLLLIERTAKTVIRLADAQSDLCLRWARSHFVFLSCCGSYVNVHMWNVSISRQPFCEACRRHG